MKIEMYLVYTREDVKDHIPYPLVAETFSRHIVNTMRGKRVFNEMFPTEAERKRVMELVKQAKMWYFKTGVPDTVKMLTRTAQLWDRLFEYCLEVNLC